MWSGCSRTRLSIGRVGGNGRGGFLDHDEVGGLPRKGRRGAPFGVAHICARLVFPTTYSRPWTLESSWWRTDEQMYETGCHEGNIGLAAILAGARAEERK